MRRFYCIIFALFFCIASLMAAPKAIALDNFEYRDDRSPWSLRARIGIAMPEYEETYTPASTTDGGKDIVSSAIFIDSDLSYQLSPRFSLAASLGYAAQEKEDFFITSSSVTAQDNSKVSVIPTTFTLRFHPAPYGKLNPYFGGGVAYILSFNDFVGAEIENGSGLVVQAGVDYWINNQFLFNFDIKQITAEFDVDYTNSFNGTPVSATYTYDPLLISAGVGLRF